jgi:hypothetical protein
VVFYDGRSPWTAAGNGIENPGKFNYIDGGCDNGTIEPPRVCCASRIKPPKIHFCEFLYDFALKRNKLLVIPEDQIRAAANLISEKGVDRMFDQFVEGYFESKGLAREEERERAYRISWKLPGSSK